MVLAKKIGVDLGTANSLVYVVGEGVVVNEPTVVAVSLDDERVVAVGNKARQMLGRTPGNIRASRPMRDGVIADYRVTEAMLRFFLKEVMGKGIFKPEVMVSVPAGVTQVEKRAVMNATRSAGARQAYLIDEPLAAAIGAGIPIEEASGNMILNMGGGASEAAVISLGGVVASSSVRAAGNKIDGAIAGYARRKQNLVMGDQTAERVKIKMGSATPLKKEKKMEVKGRDSVTGLPRTIELTSSEVTEAIQAPLGRIVDMVKRVLEEVPPELSSDIIDKGLVLAGGTAKLRNLDKKLTQELNIPVFVAEEPLLCVIKGIGEVLKGLEEFKKYLKLS